MALEIVTVSFSGSGTLRTLNVAGNSLILVQGVTLGSTDSSGFLINASDVSVQIDGTLATEGNTIAGFLAQGARILVGETGTLFSNQTNAGFANVALGTSCDLINHGLISTPSTTAVLLGGPDCEVFNTGTITGITGIRASSSGLNMINQGVILATARSSPPVDASEGVGVSVLGADARIVNGSDGRISSSAADGAGVRAGALADGIVVENHGEITAADGTGVDFAPMNAGQSGVLRNFGVISGGIRSFDGSEDLDSVTNGGLMQGDIRLNDGADLYLGLAGGIVVGAVFGGTGNDTLIGADADDVLNGGANDDLLTGGDGDDTLTGDVGLDTIRGGAGDDVLFVAAGTARLFGGEGDDDISITVDSLTNMAEARGGAGNDRFQGGNLRDDIFGGNGDDVVFTADGTNVVDGGAGSDLIEGGVDSDTLSGGADDDSVHGLQGADLLAGNGGSDTLTGFQGNDTISGGFGDDDIFGGGENDALTGESGRDTLNGGNGSDSIFGGADDDVLRAGGQADSLSGDGGNDLLNGELGADILTGGAGRDSFVFSATSHSGTGAAADRVTDFERGQDTIDVSALAGAALVFRGTAAFSGAGTASVRYDVVGGNAILRIDADGNGTTDSEVILVGIATLTSADFML